MPPSQLDQVESTLTGAATTLTNLFNLAPGPTAIVGFLAQGVFKGIRLGLDIRKAQQEASAALDAQIRARSILRSPIIVDLSALDIRTFYRNDENLDNFPALRTQFEEEIAEFDRTGGNPSRQIFEILGAARLLVPEVHDDLKFQDEQLDSLFGIWLNPVKPDFHGMVLEYVRLFPSEQQTFSNHYARMENFWKDQLEFELQGIDRQQLEAQAALNQKVRGLVNDAIFGSSGFATSSLDLAKKLKGVAIDEEIQQKNQLIEKRKQDLTAATDDDKPAIQADIDRLGAEVTKLSAWKERIG